MISLPYHGILSNVYMAVGTTGRRKYVDVVLFLLYKITNLFSLMRSFGHSTCINSKKSETHYEVLNLSNDCSKRDIRNAFVRLSKQVRNAAVTTGGNYQILIFNNPHSTILM